MTRRCAPPERIVDPDDSRLADYRILRDGDLLRRRGRFVVEGRTNLRVLLEHAPLRPESILLGATAWSALREELERHATDVPIYLADPPLLESLVGFSVHRGALALCARPAAREAGALIRAVRASGGASRIVVLEDVRDADNVGAIFRNALALGARAVFLSDGCCDPLYRKAIRTSMGASLRVPFARVADLVGFLARLRESGFVVVAFDPKEPGEALGASFRRIADPVALVVGTEGPGLSAAARAVATRTVRIAMEPGVDSLNVATAVAIGLHALRGDG
ncbi:MAG: RNA methyltransferase [Myxococcota bacterium]